MLDRATLAIRPAAPADLQAVLDLYAQPVATSFDEATGFDAMPGGSPTNVAIAAARLGVTAGVFSAVGHASTKRSSLMHFDPRQFIILMAATRSRWQHRR